MRVALKRLYTLPALIPIPQLDGHIITGGEDKWLCGMHNDGPDVVRVSFEGGYFLTCIVVEDAQMEVVRANHEPVLAGNEAASANGDIGDLKGLDESLGLVRPDVDMACDKLRRSAPPSETSWGSSGPTAVQGA